MNKLAPAILAIGFTSMACAQAAAFEDFDANQDGYISTDEAIASPALTEQFAAVDADGDGQISKDEYAAATQ